MTPFDLLSWFVMVGYVLLISITVTVLVLENRQPAKTVAWVLLLVVVPVVGWIIFYFFGQNVRKEKYIEKQAYDQLNRKIPESEREYRISRRPEAYKRVIEFNYQRSRAVLTHDNQVNLMWQGKDFIDQLLADIESAQHHIHVQTYILEDDDVGRRVVRALAKKAEQVSVRLLYDDVGCWNMPKHFLDSLRIAKGETQAYMPVRFRSLTHRANYRNHRKVVVIDGHIGYVGGMNLAQRYMGTPNSVWRDAHMRIVGSAVTDLQRVFVTDWYFASNQMPYDSHYFPAHFSAESPNADDVKIQIIWANPVSDYPNIMYSLTWMIQNARRYFYLQTPYFMPSESVLQALCVAAQSGVDVRVMVPKKPDALLLRWGNDSYVEDALRAGIRVFVYEAGFLHSKCAVADDDWCTIGSSNMDQRSFDNNFEINAFVYDEGVAKQVREQFFKDAKHCRELNLKEWKRRPFYKKCMESVTRIVSPVL